MDCDVCKKVGDCMWRHNAEATLSIEEMYSVNCARFVLDEEAKLQRDIKNKGW